MGTKKGKPKITLNRCHRYQFKDSKFLSCFSFRFVFYYITEIQSEEFEFQSLVADSQPATLPYANLSIERSFTVVEDETYIHTSTGI
jgi:hypothetical protein